MTATRRFLGLILCLLLTAANVQQLSQLREKSQFFQLREALQRSGWNDSGNLFYRALVESHFGQETAAIADFQKFLARPGDSVQQREAYEELASALVRVGRDTSQTALRVADYLGSLAGKAIANIAHPTLKTE